VWALAVCSRRYRQRGGDPALITAIAVWAVPAGVLGAHLYHVITDYELYLPPHGHPLTLKVWDGGLGIWGGVAAGLCSGRPWPDGTGPEPGTPAPPTSGARRRSNLGGPPICPRLQTLA